MAEKETAAAKAPKARPREFVTWEKKRSYITDERLAALKKDHPESFQERNSVRPDRIQIEGLWYALELPDDEGRRYLVGLK